MEGREHDIRPCVGATYCLDRIYEGHEALCVHNPATGREATMPHVIAKAGQGEDPSSSSAPGPAGLEAARVAGERGHKVTLFEAATEAGGQIRLATQPEAPPRTDRHRRLARGAMRAPGRRHALQHLCRSRRRPGARARCRHRRHRRPAAEPQHRRRRRSRRVELGHSVGRCEARRATCCCSTTTAPIPASPRRN